MPGLSGVSASVEPDGDDPWWHWSRWLVTLACVLYFVVLKIMKR